jgi:hypothetical protein
VSNVIKLKSFATKTKQKRRRKHGITKWIWCSGI